MDNNTSNELLKDTMNKIEGAYAPATIRAYKANFEQFMKFCDEIGECALPANSNVVASYIKKLTNRL